MANIRTTNCVKTTVLSSKDGKYRFVLERDWTQNRDLEFINEKALFILINPSKASSLMLDNTLCNISNYCVKEGYKYLRIVNLFPLMTTKTEKLSRRLDEEKETNLKYITESVIWANDIFIAWGSRDVYIRRKRDVEQIIKNNFNQKKIKEENRGKVQCWKDKDGNYPQHLRVFSDSWELVKYINKYTRG